MEYEVGRRAFVADGQTYRPGERVDAAVVNRWRNARHLIERGFLVPAGELATAALAAAGAHAPSRRRPG